MRRLILMFGQTDFNQHLLPMPQNNYSQCQQEFEQFREKLYQSFNYRRDTVMNLVDAIAANTTARSPVELCLSPLFPREYSALYKGIQAYRSRSQNNCNEADKKEKAQLEARLHRNCRTDSDTETRTILSVRSGCHTPTTSLRSNLRR